MVNTAPLQGTSESGLFNISTEKNSFFLSDCQIKTLTFKQSLTDCLLICVKTMSNMGIICKCYKFAQKVTVFEAVISVYTFESSLI